MQVHVPYIFSSAGFTFVDVEAVPADGLPVWIIVVAVAAAVLLVLVRMTIITIIIMAIINIIKNGSLVK